MSQISYEYPQIGTLMSKAELSAKDLNASKSLTNFLAKYERISKEDKKNHGMPKTVKADVWLIKDKTTSKTFIMKIIERSKNSTFTKQVEIQRRIFHPNFIKITDYFEDFSHLYVVTEHLLLGNLSTLIVHKRQLNEREACLCFVQVCALLNFMHNNGLVHRDIRPESILVDKQLNVKLVNLYNGTELAEITGKLYLQQNRRSVQCGVLEYMAPEMVQHKLYDRGVDVWGLGVLLYEMLRGCSPFKVGLWRV
eukprot:TRINITY_DN5585_c0_g1_i2.p1 TRINITY_DN5585_c0_g1~~TRINITY_DN5585_c0_g1_i2.p1  ORF type:complete len:252 (+),score=54.72 TRINITY_DN5585_c0_g1_i2:149-904(+)